MHFPESKRRKTPVPAPSSASPFSHYYEEARRALEAAQLRDVLAPVGTALEPNAPPPERGADGDVVAPRRS